MEKKELYKKAREYLGKTVSYGIGNIEFDYDRPDGKEYIYEESQDDEDMENFAVMDFLEDLLVDFTKQELDRAREVTGETSDGYHTFNELYEHRHLLFSKLAEWKSKKHSDGTMFDGWFIAGIGKEEGEQITYHMPLRLWDSFNCKELDTAPEWDGHTPNDVLERLSKLTTK